MKNGYEASINSAVRRRDSILAPLGVAATETSEATGTPDAASTNVSPSSVPASQTSSSATSSSTEPQTSNASSVSSSQKIAQAVLAGESAQPSLTPDMARLSAALSVGSGVPGNPIVVTLSERKSLSAVAISSNIVANRFLQLLGPGSLVWSVSMDR